MIARGIKIFLLLTIVTDLAVTEETTAGSNVATLLLKHDQPNYGEVTESDDITYRVRVEHAPDSKFPATKLDLAMTFPWFVTFNNIENQDTDMEVSKLDQGNILIKINELALQSTIDLPVKMKLNNSISLEKGHHLIVIPMTLRYDYDDGAGETKSGLAQSSVSIPIVVPGCSFPLGMTNGEIKFYQMDCSSSTKASKPEKARYDDQGDAWCASVEDRHQFVQVTLQRKTRVTAIATKGRLHKPSWVTSYYIQYSTDGNNWLDYTENGLPKKFGGNTDQTTEVKHWFLNRFAANHVRILPKTWVIGVCLRFELYGCELSESKNCLQPLGLESGRIPTEAITDSSTDPMSFPDHARLNKPVHDYPFGWMGRTDSDDWLQVDLGSKHKVSKIAIQGGHMIPFYVLTYRVQYSNNNLDWFDLRENETSTLFHGPQDPDEASEPMLVTFMEPFETRYLRIIPDTFSGMKVLRTEIYGCLIEDHMDYSKSPVPLERRSVLLNTQKGHLYVCVYKADSESSSCVLTRNGRTWKSLDPLVIAVITLQKSTGDVFAVDRAMSVLKSNDTGSTWSAITDQEWIRISSHKEDLEYTKPLDDMLPGDSPTQDRIWEDAFGTSWGVSGRGVHVMKAADKDEGLWKTAARWKCCGE